MLTTIAFVAGLGAGIAAERRWRVSFWIGLTALWVREEWQKWRR